MLGDKYEDVNDYIFVEIEPIPLECHTGWWNFDYFGPIVINSGKYSVYETNDSDEVELYNRVDMFGPHTIIGMYYPVWAHDWVNMYFMAMRGNRMAIDYIMRLGMIEQGFRTMTAYGYDFEGWDLLIDWDFNWVFTQHGASAVRPDLWETSLVIV